MQVFQTPNSWFFHFTKLDNLLKPVKQRLERDKNDPWDSDIALYKFSVQLIKNIDTLEVKEVDLKKEAELIANGIMIGVQANKYNTVVYNTKRNDFNHSHLMLAARKGIELGLKTRTDKELIEGE